MAYIDVPTGHTAMIVPAAVASVFRARYPLLFGKPTAAEVKTYMRYQDGLNKAAPVTKVTPSS